MSYTSVGFGNKLSKAPLSADPVHVWLVMNKARQAIELYALREIQRAGLGDSGFLVLEVLLHKGPLPVNTIGPKVNLTPGSISVAADRLHNKGLVSPWRVTTTDESASLHSLPKARG